MPSKKAPLNFKEGGLRKHLGVSPTKKMTPNEHKQAANSKNPLIRQEENFYKNVLSKGHGKRGK